MFSRNIDLPTILMYVIAFFVALTVHEYAHARAALAAGDDTAKLAGRVSLNPLDHLDPVGTIMFALMLLSGLPGLAWGKPVPINPYRLKNPRWDSLRISLWGPLSNLITAIILALVLRIGLHYFPMFMPAYLAMIILFCVVMNLGLALFNLIPIAPLDGSHILSSLLPEDLARRYEITMARYGMIILLALILVPIHGNTLIGWIIGPVRDFMLRLLVGYSF